MKQLLLFITTLFFLFVVTTTVVAQSSVEKSTRVGNPPIPSPGQKVPAPPANPATLQADIEKQFGIRMEGYSQKHMQWAWEKLWDVSHTNFIKLINPQPGSIRMIPGPSQQHGPKYITLEAWNDEELFKIVLIHELSHCIYWYNKDADSRQTEHNNLFGTIGGVTGYGATNKTENYPEMITYYLNPGIIERTSKNYNKPIVPYANGRNSQYFELAKKILGDY